MNKYTIYDFIAHTKKNKMSYNNYCEVIIDPYGNIIEAKPSHTETVIAYAMEKENKTRDEIRNEIPFSCLPLEWCIDKHGLVAVWYSGYMYGTYKQKHPNRFQRRSLDILIKNGLIIEEYIAPATEYGKYIERKAMGYAE